VETLSPEALEYLSVSFKKRQNREKINEINDVILE
jgi:hypothetical protein